MYYPGRFSGSQFNLPQIVLGENPLSGYYEKTPPEESSGCISRSKNRPHEKWVNVLNSLDVLSTIDIYLTVNHLHKTQKKIYNTLFFKHLTQKRTSREHPAKNRRFERLGCEADTISLMSCSLAKRSKRRHESAASAANCETKTI